MHQKIPVRNKKKKIEQEGWPFFYHSQYTRQSERHDKNSLLVSKSKDSFFVEMHNYEISYISFLLSNV